MSGVSVQVNLRLDDDVVVALDEIAAEEGRTRTEVVRDAVERRLGEQARRHTDAAYRRAYEEQPETSDELRRAAHAASRLTSEEPWERWW